MTLFSFLLDLLLHVDRHLGAFVASHGAWVYAIIFLIVFVETGLVVMPFLPGDSLLFIAGALSATGIMNFELSLLVLFVAAFLGDQCNYSIGHLLGPKIFDWPKSRFFNKAAFDKAHAFYERYGAITIVFARFLPFMRTFVPFVAGVAMMKRSTFVVFNALGAFIWVVLVGGMGYLFGNLAVVKNNLEWIIWGMVFIPGLLALLALWRSRRRR